MKTHPLPHTKRTQKMAASSAIDVGEWSPRKVRDVIESHLKSAVTDCFAMTDVSFGDEPAYVCEWPDLSNSMPYPAPEVSQPPLRAPGRPDHAPPSWYCDNYAGIKREDIPDVFVTVSKMFAQQVEAHALLFVDKLPSSFRLHLNVTCHGGPDNTRFGIRLKTFFLPANSEIHYTRAQSLDENSDADDA